MSAAATKELWFATKQGRRSGKADAAYLKARSEAPEEHPVEAAVVVEHDDDDAITRMWHVVATCDHLHACHHLQQSSRAREPRPLHSIDARAVCATRWKGEEEDERGRKDEVRGAYDGTHDQAGEYEGADEAHDRVAGSEEHCDRSCARTNL